MGNLSTFDKIDAYLNGTLKGNEAVDFNEELKVNQQLYEKVKMHKAAREVIVDYNLVQLRNKISLWTIENQPKATNPSTNKYTKISIGIIGVVGLLALLYYLYPQENIKNIEAPLQSTTIVENDPILEKEISNSVVSATQLKSNAEYKRPLSKVLTESANSTSIEQTDELTIIPEQKALIPISRLNPAIDVSRIVEIQKEVIVNTDCYNTLTLINTSYSGSCFGELSGYIVFEENNIGNGAPYHYSIDGGRSFSSTPNFEQLANGVYHLAIQDKIGCIYYHAIEYVELLEKKDCNTSNETAFSPLLGEYWKPNMDTHTIAQLVIFNKTGASIFNRKIDTNFKWEGISDNGTSLPMGSYLYVITYDNNIMEKGYVTILK